MWGPSGRRGGNERRSERRSEDRPQKNADPGLAIPATYRENRKRMVGRGLGWTQRKASGFDRPRSRLVLRILPSDGNPAPSGFSFTERTGQRLSDGWPNPPALLRSQKARLGPRPERSKEEVGRREGHRFAGAPFIYLPYNLPYNNARSPEAKAWRTGGCCIGRNVVGLPPGMDRHASVCGLPTTRGRCYLCYILGAIYVIY